MAMQASRVILGCDVSQQWLDLSVHGNDQIHHIPNQRRDINRILKRSPEYETLFERYRQFTEAHPVVAEFVGDEQDLTGATIRVYRMP